QPRHLVLDVGRERNWATSRKVINLPPLPSSLTRAGIISVEISLKEVESPRAITKGSSPRRLRLTIFFVAEMRMIEAVRAAITEEMERDERVLVLGEDVGRKGGVFGATDGLYARFGE